MNKDAILATIIGFVVGLLITGLLLVGPKLLSYLPKITLPTITMPTRGGTPTATLAPSEFGVTIDSPLAESIETTDTLLVSGTSLAGSTIVIQTDADDEVVLAKGDGKYAGKITLVEGKNELSVTSYLKDKQATQKRTIYFTPEEF